MKIKIVDNLKKLKVIYNKDKNENLNYTETTFDSANKMSEFSD